MTKISAIVDQDMSTWGYVAVERQDLVVGRTFIEIDIVDLNPEDLDGSDPTQNICAHEITLDDKPVRLEEMAGEQVEYVYYHCPLPHFNGGQCFCPLVDFLNLGEGNNGEYVRYYKKK